MLRISVGRTLTLLSLLVLTISVGIYSLTHTETLLVSILQPRMTAFGISQLTVDKLALAQKSVHVNQLTFNYRPADNLSAKPYKIRLENIHATLNWRQLLEQPLNTVTIANLTIMIDDLPASLPQTNADTQGSAISDLLPHLLIAKVPAATVNVQHWAAQTQDKKISGTLLIENNVQQFSATADLPFADEQLSVDLFSNPKTPLRINARWQHQDADFATLNTHLIKNSESENISFANQKPEKYPWRWQADGTINLEQTLATLRNDALLANFLGIKKSTALEKTQRLIDKLFEDELQVKGQVSFSTEMLATDQLTLPPALIHVINQDNTEINQDPLGQLTVTTQATVQQSGNKASLAINARTNIDITEQNWKVVTTASTTDKHTNAAQSHWLSASVQPDWINQSTLLQELGADLIATEYFAPDKPLTLTDDGTAITGHAFNIDTITSNNFTLNVYGNKTIGLNAKVQTSNTNVSTLLSHPVGNSNIVIELTNAKHPLVTQRWQGVTSWRLTPTKNQHLTGNLNLQNTELKTDIRVNTALKPDGYSLAYTIENNDLSRFFSAFKKMFSLPENITEAVDAIKLTNGSLSLQGSVKNYNPAENPKKNLASQLQITLENATGLYNNTAFEGLKLTGVISGIPGMTPVKTAAPMTASIDKLHVGTTLENFEWRGQLLANNEDFSLAGVRTLSLTANLLGGDITLEEPFDYAIQQGTGQGKLRAQNWQLDQLVALQKQDIEAKGSLDGQIEFSIKNNRLEIPSGKLSARSPGGIIRYPLASTRAIVASSPELDLAMRMLDNFQYRILTTDVKLDNAGELHLGLNLTGKNPAELNNRDVEFNINIDQNILPLLQSLRLSDQMVNRLQKQISKREQQAVQH